MFCLEQGSVQTLHGALRRCRLQLQSLSGVFDTGSSTRNLPTDYTGSTERRTGSDGRESEEAEA